MQLLKQPTKPMRLTIIRVRVPTTPPIGMATDGDRDSEDNSGHDHRNCVVCSFLAITPVMADVVDLPQTSNDVWIWVVDFYSASPRSLAPQVSRLRGPPAPQICG